tara:strand:+ start:83 stop:1477 length:1395 start_codon:yes stop_codon:yes gene_type:complete
LRPNENDHLAMNQLYPIIFTIIFHNAASAQLIPNNYFSNQKKKILNDIGVGWESLTIFENSKSNLDFYNKAFRSLSNHIDGYMGFDLVGDNSYAIYGHGRYIYKKHYYGYIYPSLINQINTRKNIYNIKTRLMNDMANVSGLGYKNTWLTLEVSKGKENWGAGNDIQLALSDNSGSYDYFLLASDYGKIRVRYIHGFLENVEEDINRYITARGFEWTNQKSLNIGFSEIVIYSGVDRLIDFGYLNPISSHLEIEANKRLNHNDGSNNNAVWQIHFDYQKRKKLRISFNYLFDEFVIDRNIQIGKEHGKAYSMRLAYTPKLFTENILTLYSSYVFVGTPTFRHKVGTNNFVQNGMPLGWQGGSDGREFRLGLNYFNKSNMIVSTSMGIMDNGEESITERIFDPYKDYIKGSFPSGKVQKIIYLEASNSFLWQEKFSFTTAFYWVPNDETFDFKLSIQLLQTFKTG